MHFEGDGVRVPSAAAAAAAAAAYYQLNVFFPLYILMHTGGNVLNLNLNIAGLLLQETYASTDTSSF